MKKNFNRNLNRIKRKKRVAFKIKMQSRYPCLKVFRSLKHIYAQIIDSDYKNTIISCSTLSKEIKEKEQILKSSEKAKLVGELIAKKGLEKGIKKVVFDKSGYVYHGVIKALADGTRKGGLEF